MTTDKGISYQELLDQDSCAVPPVLRFDKQRHDGPNRIPVERYTSKEFFDLEVDRVWKRVWQMACREEDIPNVGDHLVYDIVGMSFLIVRSDEDEIKAYWNACLHRGLQLRHRRGHSAQLRCPYHGWCWSLKGDLKQIPADWDFEHVNKEEQALPSVKVGRWGGFVFINPDPDCESLESFLGELPEHFKRWALEDRYKAAHVAKIIHCNWKVAQEAFMEALHVVGTHPQLMCSIGDSNSQNDAFENFSRTITPNGTPSPHLRTRPSEQEMADNILDVDYGEPSPVTVPEGTTARAYVAEGRRKVMRAVVGDEEADALCDAELMDSIYYTLFPNLHPWGAYNRIVYRFRPFEKDHRKSIMEVIYLEPIPKGAERPPAADVHWLEADDDWVEAPELGMLARVFNQDNVNLPYMQLGLETTQKSHIQISNYNETKLAHFHKLLEEWIEDSA